MSRNRGELSRFASFFHFGNLEHSLSQRWMAIGTCAAFLIATVYFILVGSVPGPHLRSIIPVAAVLWGGAELLTAAYLFMQFYINGGSSLVLVASAFLLTSVLAVPYAYFYPGAFLADSVQLGDQQISLWIAIVWHCVFPSLIAFAFADYDVRRPVVFQKNVLRTIGFAFVVVLLVCCGVVAGIVHFKNELPLLVIGGHYQAAYTYVVSPFVVILNMIAIGSLVRRGAQLTVLQLSFSVTLIISSLASMLGYFSYFRYSLAWYGSVGETVLCSGLVLLILAADVFSSYLKIERLANRDALTGLPNRQFLDDHITLTYKNAKRMRGKMALLIVDIDFFSGYNEMYGHHGGDECLRIIASKIRVAVSRPLDLVSRYDGEKFVVVLPDTNERGAVIIGERVRRAVEDAHIPYVGRGRGHVTVSVGVGYIADARMVLEQDPLFAAADAALYEAKLLGRNRVVSRLCEVLDPQINVSL